MTYEKAAQIAYHVYFLHGCPKAKEFSEWAARQLPNEKLDRFEAILLKKVTERY